MDDYTPTTHEVRERYLADRTFAVGFDAWLDALLDRHREDAYEEGYSQGYQHGRADALERF